MLTVLRNVSGSSGLDPVTPEDATWILTASFVIFTMQTGFGLLEAGSVAKKNQVNILMKNAVDVVLGGLSYWMFGYGLQYGTGPGTNPFCGFGSFFLDADPDEMGIVFATFIFQLSFATTATTIVSGAMAERADFNAYCIFSFLNTFIYCVPAGWLWREHGFLKSLGALDFAGSAGVHLLGGTSGLVAASMLKPRLRRCNKMKNGPLPLGRPITALIGTFTLWWGWLVFNCGSTFGISNHKWQYAARAAVNTINASIGGGLVGLLYTYIRNKHFNVGEIITSVMGSLVSISGGSAFFRAWEAVIVGAVGALLVSWSSRILSRFRVDDPVGTVAVHGVGGAWGMAAVGLFVEADHLLELTGGRKGLLRGGGFQLLGIQLLACLVVVVWSALTTILVLKTINFFIPIRMSLEHEILGADFAEHDIRHEGYDYEGVMTELALEGLTSGGGSDGKTSADREGFSAASTEDDRGRCSETRPNTKFCWKARSSRAADSYALVLKYVRRQAFISRSSASSEKFLSEGPESSNSCILM